MLKIRAKGLSSNPVMHHNSQSSLSFINAGTSGPPRKESALITSTWGIGWQTPTAMIACYALALVLAVVHLILFRYIDGKEADGPNRIAPQAYISTASNILANAFGFSLRASLAIAFVQRLWLLLRAQTMKVSTIEALFSIRSNPLMLFKPAAIAATPLLCILALVMWITQFVTGFPPGAITVVSVQKSTFGTVNIPSFNASYMGNGSGVDAEAFSLTTLTPVQGLTPDQSGFQASGFSENKNTNLINLLARQILVAGESFSMPSPCGVNCSYTMSFEGPYMNCNSSSDVLYYDDATGIFNIYTGQWFSPLAVNPNPTRFYNGTYTQAFFNATTINPIQVNGSLLDGNGNSSALVQQGSIVCAPGRANFTVTNNYENNVWSRNVSSEPIDTLINLAVPTHDHVVIVPGFGAASGTGPGTTPANWSLYALDYYRDTNIMTIHGSLSSWLNGSFQGFFADGENFPVIGPSVIGDPYGSYLPLWNEQIVTTTEGQAVSIAAQNGTVIESTRFNTAFGHFSLSESSHPSFNITQDLINEYLFNMTTSMMLAYSLWDTTANATKLTRVNVYSFSQPLSLVLPYFITLFVTMPFVVMGCLALFKNGVSAMDGSFMQIIATSTGSATLDRAAAGGCLGGDESMPQELKDLEIKFGEFIGRDEPGRIKRAGFGLESEVKELERGDKYGIARWI
ncbi:uncharacterized protein LY89DRAFT_727350 [Mollisia scopiformis]|uniref:Uncharacterized protein n=1 Tax=Mollisia scopiformis TaxID=149040 RepID=A0A194XVR9_MOLSC|nr:uncharacterized protein LY89DRAFT_727350 [Mollisia scopiformis]KUJ24318.1 hypothetical protein LY89DRAFT_727350 [Mollisia scopiformis]